MRIHVYFIQQLYIFYVWDIISGIGDVAVNETLRPFFFTDFMFFKKIG